MTSTTLRALRKATRFLLCPVLLSGILFDTASPSFAQVVEDDASLVLDHPSPRVRRPETVFLETATHAGTRLVAAGEHGVILVSDDDGLTWRQTSVPVLATINEIRFSSDKIGWAVGHFGVVLRTDDAGEHWVRQLDGISGAQLVLREAQSAQSVAGVDGDRALRFAKRLVDDGPDKPLFLVDVLSDTHVRVFGADGLAYESVDSGKSWSDWRSHLANPRRLNLYGMIHRDTLMVVAGEQGLLMRGDPDQTLASVTPPYDGSLFGIVDGGVAGMHVFGLLGHDFVSKDDGVTWTAIQNGSTQSLTAALRLNDGQLIFSDMGGMIYKLDGSSLERIPLAIGWSISEMTLTPSGSLLVVGAGGLKRIPAAELSRALSGGQS